MAKLRKMLGDINSQECIDLMRLIETQSKHTLAAWAADYAKKNYLPIYEAHGNGDPTLSDTIKACEEHLNGNIKLADLKPSLRKATELARNTTDDPIAQAAARAVSTACAAAQTPTNSLGFLFYGAAAVAYHQVGLEETAEVYDAIAISELTKAWKSLQEAAVDDEPKPAKINWNC